MQTAKTVQDEIKSQLMGEMIGFFLCQSGSEEQNRKRRHPPTPEKDCDLKAAACEYFCKELSLMVISYGESK